MEGFFFDLYAQNPSFSRYILSINPDGLSLTILEKCRLALIICSFSGSADCKAHSIFSRSDRRPSGTLLSGKDKKIGCVNITEINRFS